MEGRQALSLTGVCDQASSAMATTEEKAVFIVYVLFYMYYFSWGDIIVEAGGLKDRKYRLMIMNFCARVKVGKMKSFCLNSFMVSKVCKGQ